MKRKATNLKMKFWKVVVTLLLFSCVFVVLYVLQVNMSKSMKKVQISENTPNQRPTEWSWDRRTFPYYKADANAYRKVIKKAKKMRSQAVDLGIRQIAFAGPSNIEGRVTDIEFNPQNPNIVYAGAATGGVFKSTDMGNTWTSVFDNEANLSVGDIGVDPNNSNIVYVGTGEANGGHNNFPGGGVYKSTDTGETWNFLGLENTVSIGRIVVDPSNSNRIFVAAVGSYFAPNPERGVYRSDDGGNTWDKVLFVSDSTGAIDIVIDPENPSRLIAAMWERVRRPYTDHLYGPSSGLYKSLDGGDTWNLIDPSSGLPNPETENVGRIGLALCTTQPNIVYAIYNDGSNYIGLFKSTDFGSTWTNADPNNEISQGTGSFSWYFGQVRVSPTNPDVVFALDVAYMRSVNGGDTWPIIYGYGGGPADFHVDNHALAFNPDNPNYIIEGNDGGINISADGGVNFTKVAELPITQFYEIGLDHNNPQRLYGGTQDNGTVRTLDGQPNNWNAIFGGDGFYVIVDFTNSNTIYAESQNGNLGKSIDGGSFFFQATLGISEAEPKNWSTPVVMDPNNNNVLYYGTNRVYRTTNAAAFWYSISPDLTEGLHGSRRGTVSTIAVSPQNSNIIWAGTSDSHVWVSTDNGSSWSDVSASLPRRWVTRVVPDPLNENTAYVTFSGLKWVDPQPHVFRTTNAGQTWVDISGNLPDAPINAFAIDPTNNKFLFAGTDLGAYYSDNNGASWHYLDEGLPLVPVYDMKINPSEHFLALGTHGRSMYKLDLSTLVRIDNQFVKIENSKIQLEKIYPNPFSNQTNIEYVLPEKENVVAKIYNSQGRLLKILINKEMPSGKHQLKWNGCNSNGVRLRATYYFLKISAGTSTATRKLILVN